MTRPKSDSRRRREASTSAGAPQRAAWIAPVAIVLTVGYLLVFYVVRLPDLDGASRAEAVQGIVLLPDEVAKQWLGDPAQFALGDRLRVLVPAVAFFAVCGLVGFAALEVIGALGGLAPLEQIFFSASTGCGLVALYTLLVGLAGGLHWRATFLTPLLGAIAWGLLRLRQTGLWRVARSPDSGNAGRDDDARSWLWWAVPFVVAIAIGGALTPVEFDVREYHLQVPKEFYQSGRITFLPHNVYGNMPLGSEMLPLAAMVAVGDWWFGALVGKAMIALAAPLAALGLLAAGRRFVSTRAGVIAALVYISTPWIARVSTLGLVEGFSSLYLWGTVYAVLIWWRDEHGTNSSRLLLAGFLAGSAAACKYPNVLYVLIPAFLVVVVRARRQADSAAGSSAVSDSERPPSFGWLRPVAAFVLAASVACGPWFVKNWVLTGNPIYPLAYGIFDGSTRDAELHAQWQRAHRPPGFGPVPLLESAANVSWRSAWINPLVLPLAILGVATSCYRRLSVGLTAYALFVLTIWWLFTHRIDRFWIPVMPVLALLAGLAVSPGAIVPWRWPIKAVIAGCLALNLILILGGGAGDIAYFVSVERLLKDPTRVHVGHQFLNENLTEDDVLLTVADAEVFDLRMPVLYNTVFDRDRFESLMADRTTDERRQALADLGVKYVAVAWTEVERYRSPGNYGFTDYIQPALFEELVQTGVLAPALALVDEQQRPLRYQIFPVPGASSASK
jgi:hypothetical protein